MMDFHQVTVKSVQYLNNTVLQRENEVDPELTSQKFSN